MKVLLDTHAVLWYVLDDKQLSARAKSMIDDGDAEILVSPASYWEIAIKISVGKYSLTTPYETFWRHAIEDNDLRILPITVQHTAILTTLPFHHRDPFDRLLIAQAIFENIDLVSNDPTLDAYPIRRLW